MFEKFILKNKDEIVNKVCDLITYPSVSIETKNSSMPFGKACNDALKYFLHLAEELSFKTKNIDGYCGYAEFGDGDELIGIIGHLDVVPAMEEDWKYSPFTPTIANECIYGRGSIDDKGPVIASLYAMKAVADYAKENNIKLNKRVRLIVGLNEEKDWKCIEYYKAYEEIPTVGFSPDSDFPCIYAEKSVISLTISDPIDNLKHTESNIISNIEKNISTNLKANVKYDNRKIYLSKEIPSKTEIPFSIDEVDCANNAINVVPKFCSIILKIQDTSITSKLISVSKKIIEKYNYEIDLYKIDEEHVKLTSYGTASHSAHPELGVNSISKLIVILNDIFKEFSIIHPLLDNFGKYIGDDYTGKKLNLNLSDESGNLTLNTSQLYIKDNKIYIGINLRVPVHTQPEYIISIFEEKFKDKINVLKIQPALYIDKNCDLVKKLCSIFNETCKTNFEPIAIGGATYARAFPNCISFGMNFPNDKDMCHQADEFVDINKLLLSCNIYAKAIYELIT